MALLKHSKTDYFVDKDTLDENRLEVFFSALNKGLIQTQYGKDGSMYLNPHGTISRAEVFHALGTSQEVFDSVDGVSNSNDFFNAGYNQIVSDEDSNFYDVYSKEDLFRPIKRVELGYLLAHYDNFDYADDFNYEGYLEKLYSFNDVKFLNLELPTSEELFDLLPKDYNSIENYFYALVEGEEILPLGLALLTINLASILDDHTNLYFLKEVSRLDFVLILDNLGLLNKNLGN